MRERRWVLGCCVIALLFGVGGEAWAAALCSKRGCVPQSGWGTNNGKTLFVPVADKVWRTYQSGRLTSHVYHEYRKNEHFVALYDVKRHLAVRLHRRFVLARWSFRAGLPMWILVHRGKWVRATKSAPRAPTPRRAAASRPSARPTAAPTSQPTTRPSPTSRRARRRPPPARRIRIASKAKSSPLAGLPLLPKVKFRRLFRRYSWVSPGKKLRVQHVAGQLWRVFRGGEPAAARLVELYRTRDHVTLFAPMRKHFVRLSSAAWQVKFPGDKWRTQTTGRWTKQRLPVRFSWIVAGKSVRWHHLRGRFWGLFHRGRFARKLAWLRESNPTYVTLGNSAGQIRLYEGRAFLKKKTKGPSTWRRLAKGRWDDNPATYTLPHKLRRLLAKLGGVMRKRRKQRQPVARRPSPRRAPPRARGKRTRPPRHRAPQPRRLASAKVRKAPKLRKVAAGKKGSKTHLRRKPPKARSKRGDRRLRVTRPKSLPWRKVAFVRVTLRNGRKRFAAGVMIGPRTLLTAGHVIYNRKTKKTARTLWVYPGLYNRKMTYGATYPLRWSVHPKWISAKRSQVAHNHDLAVVYLKKPLGTKTGYVSLRPAPPLLTKHSTLVAAGYPLDKFFKTKKLWMWYAARKGHAKAPGSYPWKERILTNHRVFRGMDGGPLLRRKSWVLVGICRGTAGGRGDFVRMTQAKVAWVRATQRKLQGAFKPKSTPFDGDDEPPDELRFWEGKGVDLDALGKKQ